jgi:glycosyltransferase involved in cell wall biosynthesis
LKRKKNILVLTYWSLKDALIQAYTLPYLRIIYGHVPQGSKIYLITFEQEKQQLPANEMAQMKQRLRMQGIRLITLSYSKFGIMAMIKWIFYIVYLISLIFIRRINYIHAWCTPAGSIAYVLSKLTGKKLIIDSYEPHADAMVENQTWNINSLQFRMLFYFEKKLTSHASIIISATQSMLDYAKKRYGVSITNFYVKPACVDQSFFAPKKRKNEELLTQLNLKDKIICVYAGKFGGIYLSQEVFDFFKVAEEYWGDKFRCLILTSHPKQQLVKWAEASGFDTKKMLTRFVPHESVAEYMGLGDFAITPVKPIPSKRYCTPIKDGEYWALGLPVVITKNISDDSYLISSNEIGAVLEELSRSDYLEACIKIDKLLKENSGNELQDKIRDIAYHYRSYSIAESIYKSIYGEKETQTDSSEQPKKA